MVQLPYLIHPDQEETVNLAKPYKEAGILFYL